MICQFVQKYTPDVCQHNSAHVVVTVGSESADFTPVWTGALLGRSALGSKFLESPGSWRVEPPVRAVLSADAREGAITGKENGERGKEPVRGTREGRSAAWARVQDALQPHTGGSVLP